MEWYVIQAYSGYEQKVKMALEEKNNAKQFIRKVWRDINSNRADC